MRQIPMFMAAVLAALSTSCAAGTADPAYYIKRDTWHESIRASHEALANWLKEHDSAADKPYVSPVLRGTQAPVDIKVSVAGWNDLFLIVGDVDTYNNDVANWGDARLIAADGKVTYVDTLKPATAKQGWGHLALNKSAVGGSLQVGSRKFAHGLGTHAISEIHYQIGGKYQSFEASAGVDVSRGKGEGSVQFIVSRQRVDPRTLKGGGEMDTLWTLLERDFTDTKARQEIAWERQERIWEGSREGVASLAGRYAQAVHGALAQEAVALAQQKGDAAVAEVRELFYRTKRNEALAAQLKGFDFEALRLAITDLSQTYCEKYPKGAAYLKALDDLQKELTALDGQPATAQARRGEIVGKLLALRREALLANPLLDFDKVLVVRRNNKSPRLGLPANWEGNSSLPTTGYDNEIALLSLANLDGDLQTLYKPEGGKFIGDVDLHFDADKLLFTCIGSHGRFQVFEMDLSASTAGQASSGASAVATANSPTGAGPRQITPGEHGDVDHYDACYLPDGNVLVASTATYVGVPCVHGSSHVANFYLLDRQANSMRQLTFEQEHDWNPAVLANGRVLYQRWEYTDSAHSNSRMLFHMNPDGTDQREYSRGGSYFPNSFFYARPVPGHPSQVIGIATGHHDTPRAGRLLILDPARGRSGAEGIVQEIPGRGRSVEAIVRDGLVGGTWPKFTMPLPLNSKYHIVSCMPRPGANWGIYLVDTFDNMLLLKEVAGSALLEAIPLRKTPRPPVIASRVNPQSSDATVYMQDVYVGSGLAGVPRGTVKKLRVYEYYFSYRGMGGLYGSIGMDGPWDIRRIVGTVPVEEDGSAFFKIPANTAVAVQPLDEKGQALQVMRSWFTGMPGETLSCVGCHETQSEAPVLRSATASRRKPSEIESWHGPTRGFAFAREVQPVLDRYCVSCHDGSARQDAKKIPNLRGGEMIKDWKSQMAGQSPEGGRFSRSYAELHRYLRRHGIESDRRMLIPMDYHFSTTELGQMLRKGHYGVTLDAESWERFAAWLDMNVPYHGTWHEIIGKQAMNTAKRARELRAQYAPNGPNPDYEAIPETPKYDTTPVKPQELTRPADGALACAGWPFDAAQAAAKQKAAAQKLDLGNGVTLELVYVPGGKFAMGSTDGHPDEAPRAVVDVKPFWMGKFEVTNAQFKAFDAKHESRDESRHGYQFGITGYGMDDPQQPAVRLSWEQAMTFCKWLAAKTGKTVTLPTEAQWEWACRAGTATPFWYGDVNTDFAPFANLGDATLADFTGNPYVQDRKQARYKNPSIYDNWIPQDARFNDDGFVSEPAGKYKPNAWGLHDMHGNVGEWTLSAYKPYPYNDGDGRNKIEGDPQTERVVRGGSWYDRPFRCTSSFRLPLKQYQRVFNVGFRVVMNAE